MHASLAVLAAVFVAGCSSASFDIAPGSDGAVGSDTANSVVDTGSTGSSDTGQQGGTEAGSADAGGMPTCPMPAAPVCAPLVYEPHHDLYGATPLSSPINAETQHIVSFTMAKKGRIEKVALRLRRTDNGAGVDGTFTVHAFYVPCEGTMISIGKHTKTAAEVSGDTTFYFNPDVTGGAIPYLPWAAAKTRIAFVIETNSTRYSWNLIGTNTPADNPLGHQWGTKTGAGAWVPSKVHVASTMSYIRTCE
jgi:hypothetical protein